MQTLIKIQQTYFVSKEVINIEIFLPTLINKIKSTEELFNNISYVSLNSVKDLICNDKDFKLTNISDINLKSINNEFHIYGNYLEQYQNHIFMKQYFYEDFDNIST